MNLTFISLNPKKKTLDPSLKFPLLFLSSSPNPSLSLSLSLTGGPRPEGRGRGRARPEPRPGGGQSRGDTGDTHGDGGQRVFLWIYRWGELSLIPFFLALLNSEILLN